MKIARNTIHRLVEIVMEGGAKSAVKFIAPKLVVKVTAIGKQSKRANSHNFVLTIGRPNWKERKFARQCEMAGEPFPVKKPLIKWPTDRRRRKDRKAA